MWLLIFNSHNSADRHCKLNVELHVVMNLECNWKPSFASILSLKHQPSTFNNNSKHLILKPSKCSKYSEQYRIIPLDSLIENAKDQGCRKCSLYCKTTKQTIYYKLAILGPSLLMEKG